MTNTTTALQALLDQTAIADCVRRWAFYRDGHHWAKLRDLYAADGRMTTTWTIASADEFVAHCKRMAEKAAAGNRCIRSAPPWSILTVTVPLPNHA